MLQLSLRSLSRRFNGRGGFSTIDRNTAPASASVLLRGTNREEVQGLLKLRRYDEEEIQNAFTALKQDATTPGLQTDRVDLRSGLEMLVTEKERQRAQLGLSSRSQKEIYRMSLELEATLIGQTGTGKKSEASTAITTSKSVDVTAFQKMVTTFGERLDSRVWSIGLSYLCTGLSVGIIIPCMTMLVSELQIPASAYGVVVSAFGLSKLMGNIPAGHLVEKYGRKPVMLGGSVLMGLGLSAISLVFLPGFGVDWLVACRFFSGFGVAAFIAGGNMFVSDISTPLNRARTLAPVMAAFSGGTALGPALGGALVHMVGLANTYIAIGAMFGLIGLLNHYTVTETLTARAAILQRQNQQQQQSASPDREQGKISSAASSTSVKELAVAVSSSFREARLTWRELLKSPQLRDVVVTNGVNWFALSGAQMTLLPLFLVSPALTLPASDIAMCFAYTSVISLLMSQPIAVIADKFGKYRVMMGGMSLFTLACLAIPQATDFTQLLMLLTPLSMASPCLNSIPTALISDLSSQQQRAQAMSLLRTAGDIGLLFGATVSGLVATYSSLSHAFFFDAALMSTSLLWFAKKYGKVKKIKPQD
jgi:MFS family permease